MKKAYLLTLSLQIRASYISTHFFCVFNKLLYRETLNNICESGFPP